MATYLRFVRALSGLECVNRYLRYSGNNDGKKAPRIDS
jgi:hypothetical protein